MFEAIQSFFSDKASLSTSDVFVGALTFSSFAAILTTYLAKRDVGKIQGSISVLDIEKIERALGGKKSEPFEITALASYYNQALARAQISFWFSIISASIGFALIIFAFLSFSGGELLPTMVKVVGGSVIDAVSGLFFIQSTNAQKSMGDFFEKLRLDRLNVEAREMITEIENSEIRDNLRSQLIMKYAGVDRAPSLRVAKAKITQE